MTNDASRPDPAPDQIIEADAIYRGHKVMVVASHPTPGQIIGREASYRGTRHRWARGQRVLIVSVIRRGEGGGVFSSDDGIEIRPDDVVEFAAFVPDGKGGERPSWAPSDATIDELELL